MDDPTVTLSVRGRVDGMGDACLDGRYIGLVYHTKTGSRHYMKISEGEAATLIDGLAAALDPVHI